MIQTSSCKQASRCSEMINSVTWILCFIENLNQVKVSQRVEIHTAVFSATGTKSGLRVVYNLHNVPLAKSDGFHQSYVVSTIKSYTCLQT